MKVLLTNNKSEPRIYIEELKSMDVIPIFLSDLNVGINDVYSDNLDDTIFHNMFYSNISGFVTMTVLKTDFFNYVKGKEKIQSYEQYNNAIEIEKVRQYYFELIKQFGAKGKIFGYTETTIIISYRGEPYTFTYKIPKIYISPSETPIMNALASKEYLSNFGEVKLGHDLEDYMSLSISKEEFILEFIRDTLIDIELGIQKVR